MEALGDSSHVWMAVPIKLPLWGHDHEEESVMVSALDGECHDCRRHAQLLEDGVDSGDA